MHVAAPLAEPHHATLDAVVQQYADIVFAVYSDSLSTGKELNARLNALVAAPSVETLEAAKAAWKAARIPYLQSEAFRFYGGPIDAEGTGPEGLMNAWPMDEAYIDYVEGNSSAGIINNPKDYPEISVDLLTTLNEKDGETNISTGYHAIEFLLWGQDLSASGPGTRPFSDYLREGGEANALRRGQYLLAVGDLLVGHLQGLADAWNPEIPGNYRAAFLAEPRADALQKILTGVGVLSGFEVSGERLAVAFETKAQEDEHSCFSDNTHVDMIEDARGIQNVVTGTYTRTDGTQITGPGLKALIATKDQALSETLENQSRALVKTAEEIPSPFDQAILGDENASSRVVIGRLIEELREFSATVVAAGKLFDLGINIQADEE
jgi:putative iron-regulated protein